MDTLLGTEHFTEAVFYLQKKSCNTWGYIVQADFSGNMQNSKII